MIIAAENSNPGASFPCTNSNRFGALTAMFLVDKDFSFDDPDAFSDQGEWLQAISDKNIIPFYEIKNTNDSSEPEAYEKSKFDYSFRSKDKKYAFKLEYLWNLLYHINAQNYTDADYDAMFADVNGNIYATSDDGTRVKGFTLNALDFQSMSIGDVNPAWSPVYVELYDYAEWDLRGQTVKPTWSLRKTNITFVEFQDVSATADSLSFDLVDAVYGTAISGLAAHDFEVTDATGTLAFSFIAEVAGRYSLSGVTGSITGGTIEISGVYKGSGTYTFGSVFYALLNAGGDGETDWDRTDTNVYSFTNAGGDGETDWTDSNSDGLADDHITVETLCALGESIVTGNGFTGNAQRVDIDSVSAAGFVGYLRPQNFAGETLSPGTYYIKLQHRSKNGFYFSLDFDNISNISIDIPANTGNADEYNYEFEIGSEDDLMLFYAGMRDSDGNSSGDWFEIDGLEIVQKSDVPDNWSFNEGISDVFEQSLVTGNGFTGNAVRVEKIDAGTYSSVGLSQNYSTEIELPGSGNIFIKLKYRAYSAIPQQFRCILSYLPTGNKNIEIDYNQGNAESVLIDISDLAGEEIYNINFGGAYVSTDEFWFEIDEIEIITS